MAIAPVHAARSAKPRPLQTGTVPICNALALAACVAYAAFASGAIGQPAEARLQVAVSALALLTLGGLLFAPGMRARAANAGWAGIGVLALFAVWTGATMAWSIAPDSTWAELNRALAYLLVAGVGLVIGASLPRALERCALGFLAIATVVALYALGGKVIPSLHIPGLIDLNHTAYFSRLRAPLAYWNALSLFCVMAVPIAVRTAAEPARGPRGRAAATACLVLLLTTIGLTYSRGGFAALVVVMVVLVAAGPDRLRTAAVAAAGVLGSVPPLAVGFMRDDLTHDLVPLVRRFGDGLLFGAMLAAGIVLAIFLARRLDRGAERFAPAPLPRRRATAIAVAGAIAAIALGAGALAASDNGIAGALDSFKSVKYERQNDPARILQTNSGNRWVWWSEATGAWSDKPVAGWGAGSFPLLHHRYRHNNLEVLQPHSVPLQFLAEVGLVGALLAAAALALLAVAAARRVLPGVRSEAAGIPAGREQRYATALAAAFAAWLLHIWFDWDWDIPGVTLPVMAFLGLLAARPLGLPGRAVSVPARGPELLKRVITLTLGGLLACAIALSALLPSLARDHTRAATAAAASGDFTEAVRQADIAKRLNPVAVDALLLEARAAGRRGQFGLASQRLTDAVHRQPDNPQVWLAVAKLELARDDVPAMRAAARRAIKLDPVGSAGRFFFLANDLGVRSATATGTPLPSP